MVQKSTSNLHIYHGLGRFEVSDSSSFERSEKLTVGGFGGTVSPPTGFEADSHKNLRSSSKNDLIWHFLDTFECIVLLEIMKHQT